MYGVKVEDHHVKGKILCSLTPKFDYVTWVFENSNELDTMTTNELFGAVQAEKEKMLKRKNVPLEQVLKAKVPLKGDARERVKKDMDMDEEGGVVVAKVEGKRDNYDNSTNEETSHHSTRGYGSGVTRGRGNYARTNESRYDKSYIECFSCHKAIMVLMI